MIKPCLTITRKPKARATDAPLRRLLKTAAAATLAAAAGETLNSRPGRAEISLLLTDDGYIRALNAEYRGLDAATDVLSFPLWEQAEPLAKRPPGDAALNAFLNSFSSGPLLLGDIVISTDHAAAQAEAYGHSYEQELTFLLIHGLLHLLGYDHEQSAAAERAMFDMQKRIMAELAGYFDEA